MPDLDGLRVLAFCDYWSPRSPGGSERVAAEIYRRLAAWGAKIVVVGGVPRHLSGGDDGSVPGLDVVQLPAADLSGLLGVQASISTRLPLRAFALGDRFAPDVVTTQGIHFFGSLIAAGYQFRRRVPLVTTVHVAGVEDLPALVRLPTSCYERTVGRLILTRSSSVIAVSEAVRSHLVSLVGGRPVHVIPNGVDRESFSRGARHDRDPPHIVFVGRLIANKGPETLVAALASIHQVGIGFRATFIGDGPLRPALVRAVEGARLAEHIEFTGVVSDVPDRLKGADVFVRPSSSEGMSLAVLEAMSAGLCIIASNIPANAGLVADGVTGLLCPPGDHELLAQRLRAVLLDSQLRHRLADGAHRAAAIYSWDRTARETAAVLLGSRHTGVHPAHR